jgi:hypothetical protein
MITGSYFKTFLLNAELILRLFFTAMAATLITKNVLFARDSRSNQFVTSLVDSYRHSLTSESAAFHSLSELKALLRGKLAEA